MSVKFTCRSSFSARAGEEGEREHELTWGKSCRSSWTERRLSQGCFPGFAHEDEKEGRGQPSSRLTKSLPHMLQRDDRNVFALPESKSVRLQRPGERRDENEGVVDKVASPPQVPL